MKCREILYMGFLAILLYTSGVCHAEMYVEGYVGGVTAPDQEMSFSNSTIFSTLTRITHGTPGMFDDPFLMGGGKVGMWFVKDGWMKEWFLCCDFQEWMKYFGFYLDLNYQNLDFKRRTGVSIDNLKFKAKNIFWTEGNALTVALMFAGRYGFVPDAEVPFGRLQPYLGLGPALVITSQDPAMIIDPEGVRMGPFHADPSRKTETALGLEIEPGIRWMLTKNVSIDLSCKYRYANPSFTFGFHPDNHFVSPGTMKLDPEYNLLSAQLGIAFHF